MSEPLELQAQRPYALDQLTMLQSQIMQTIQGMVVLRARIEKQRPISFGVGLRALT